MNKIDTLEVNRTVDLLTLAGGLTHLGTRPAASSGGGEWKGPCPFCNGKDRFSLQPYHQPEPRWMCRNCTDGKWKDAIEFGKRLYPGLKFTEMIGKLTGGNIPTEHTARAYEPPAPPAATPPPADWQETGRLFVAACEGELWQPSGRRALDYLHKRGLKDETIKHFHLGFNPKDQRLEWPGIEGGAWASKGIVIPCFVRGQLWYIKIRRNNDEPKYLCINGSRPSALFNAEMLDTQPAGGGLALFVEGEFDCMLTWQEAGDLLPVATLGACEYKPDLATWGRYFLGQKITFICYDLDGPGQKGAEHLAELSRYAVIIALPDGPWKDPTDYHKAGGNLRAWVIEQLEAYDPLAVSDDCPMLETGLSLGARVTEIDPAATIEYRALSGQLVIETPIPIKYQ
jgi:DNA primase